MSDVASRVVRFLERHVSVATELDHEEDLFAAGLVSSLLALQLILFVEQEFALVVDDEDLSLDNFRSIAAIEQFVSRKQVALR